MTHIRKQIKTDKKPLYKVSNPRSAALSKNPHKLKKKKIPPALGGEGLKYKEQSPLAFG